MSAEEMEVLLSTKEVMINGEKVFVKPFSFIDTLKISVKATGLVNNALKNPVELSSAISKMRFTPTEDATDTDSDSIKFIGFIEFAGLIGEAGIEFITELIKMSTELDDEKLKTLNPVEGIDVVETIYKVNKGFFTKCMNKLFSSQKKVEKKTKKTKKE